MQPESLQPPRPDPESSPNPLASKPSTVFIVDDHTMFREGLRQLIDRDPGLRVCGDAADPGEALDAIRKLRPDVVLVDLTLEGSSGLDLIRTIKAEFEEMPILVVSMHDEAIYAERALKAGAMGYVMKQEPARTMKEAIHKVLTGGIHLSGAMASNLLLKFTHGQTPAAQKSPVDSLSERELEVFLLLGQGHSARQIAAQLGVTVPTINSFRNRIKEKLQVKTSTELMLQAINWRRNHPGNTP